MRYGFGCDHAGFDLKEVLVKELVAAGHEVVDMGTGSTERTDFPVYANKVAEGGERGHAWTWESWCAGQGWEWPWRRAGIQALEQCRSVTVSRPAWLGRITMPTSFASGPGCWARERQWKF